MGFVFLGIQLLNHAAAVTRNEIWQQSHRTGDLRAPCSGDLHTWFEDLIGKTESQNGRGWNGPLGVI